MQQLRDINRFEGDRAAGTTPPLVPDQASFVDALLALPVSETSDAVDRAVTERHQLALARKLRDVLDRRPTKLAG